LLPNFIGRKRVAEVLLCNRTITAEQAEAWGLANRVVPVERIREEALSVAHAIAAKQAGSVRHTKRLLGEDCGGLAARLEAERCRFVRQIVTEEARRGIVAFLEARRALAEG
jgi:enoyl-CoA hydratase/carnithine racemase